MGWGVANSRGQEAILPGRQRGGMSLFIGKVIGTAMQKTAKVEVNKMFLHPHVLKVRSCSNVV